MAQEPLHPLMRRLRNLVGAPTLAECSDHELLARFVEHRDEAAFREIVERHGPLVLRVCRRILGERTAAEDAFQATFLVLVRKAAILRHRELLAGWLHGVATRVAQHARADQLRRRHHEGHRRAPGESGVPEWSAQEFAAVLDEELAPLPERYRLPLVLCYLEEHTQDQAARVLGWSLRTLQRRLEQGRELLRARLVRRGVPFSVTLLAAALAGGSVRATPPLLVVATVRAALSYASGALGTLSTSTLALTEGVLRTMVVHKLSRMLSIALLMGILTGGALLVASQMPTPRTPSQAAPPFVAEPTEEDARKDVHGDPLPPGVSVRMGTERWRQSAFTVAWSRDGKTIAAIPRGGAPVRLLDVATGKTRFTFPTRPGDPNQLRFAPDGNTVAISDSQDHLTFYNLATGKKVGELTSKFGLIRDFLYSPDGKYLAAAGGSILEVWDLRGKEPLRHAASQNGYFRCVAFSDDGTQFATAGSDRLIQVWDLARGVKTHQLSGHIRSVKGLAFSPEGKRLASASGNDGVVTQTPEQTVRLWDLATGKTVGRFEKTPEDACAVEFLDADTLLVAGNSLVQSWDIKTGQPKTRLGASGFYPGLGRLALSPDRRSVVMPGDRVRIWNTRDGKEREVVPDAHQQEISALAFSPDGKQLVSGSSDGTVRTWDTRTGKQLALWTCDPWQFVAVAIHPRDGRIAYTANRFYAPGSVVQRTAQGKVIEHGASEPLRARWVSYSPDGKILATADDLSVQLRESETLKVVRTLDVARGDGGPVVFAPEGRAFAVQGSGTAPVWFQGEKEPRYRLGTHPRDTVQTLAFTADQQMVTLSREGVVSLRDPRTGKERASFQLPGKAPWMCAVSPDGLLIAGGNYWEATLSVWDALTCKEIVRWEGPECASTTMTFAPDSRRLAVASRDGTILLWDLGRLLSQRGVPRPTRPAELWNQLGSDRISHVWQATRTLEQNPNAALPLLRDQLQRVQMPTPEQVERWVKNLEARSFHEREKASQDLTAVVLLVEAQLQQKLRSGASMETQRRLQAILAQIERPVTSPEAARFLRALRILEHLGTAEARKVLETIAARFPQTRLGKEAEAALARTGSP